VSIWCRELGHESFYATYYGQADPIALLPADLDVVFLSTHTRASALTYALAKFYRRQGALTVIGGSHANAFPEDCQRFFDVVVGECDKRLIGEILSDLPRGVRLTTGRPLRDVPTVEERLPELRTAILRNRVHPTPLIGLLASVGCPYQCDFCTDWNNPYAQLPLDRLEFDLRFVAEKIPEARVGFHDANFGVRFDQVMDVMQCVPKRSRTGYLMECSLSILRGPRLRRLRDTNCWYVAVGVESWTDYSGKTGVGTSARGESKLETLLEQFQQLGEHVPLVQANFIFGIDGDRGDEPMELTREFIRRAPFVWPNLCTPTPFGGTPFYDRHRRGGRILEVMPFTFYNSPYLVTRLKHYSPTEYYEKLIAILEEMTSPRRTIQRLRARLGHPGVFNALRTLGIRSALKELRTIDGLLRTDRGFRAFHEGETRELPPFYQQRFREILGPYAELLYEESSIPVLPAPAADADVQIGLRPLATAVS
jgi:radical SAM superfamily enzyme YgiQ (UPF0313 family)